ncbi:uncharacterized protein LAESUDRAFT_230296 [Laetiporus sulphureus 93-53]|uniref:STE3-domain-containing protein n=1 Tax=Laetiporus sulphureus 93-53 TaxID=1314785 RepID=A0A165DQV3_9APHY|nr:uncharacterized protein LAESUDRAFT_230296 [Laetiporus sulphureus 93-53]KZT05431.1 hypothetical protein LAESUDRAFT_230296 [Laetiporus sulphureus 93-53]
MCHTSPPTLLSWAVLSVLLGAFLLFHLWRFDRFRCLRWNNGPYSGAFKRIMTYTYLTSIPLLVIYSVGFCALKYKQGYVDVAFYGIIPTPYELWPEKDQRWIFPLYMLFSFAWGLEMVTHLEELCFWLFLVNASSVQQDWFRSAYFKIWAGGSIVAVIYMPIITIVARHDPLKSEAYSFIAGSIGSLLLTVLFMPVLYMFPKFLRGLKTQRVDVNTIVRLTTFNELNRIRVFFRFLFCAPLLILGIDALTTHERVNHNEFGTEFLAFVAGIGCMVSSGITLVIFFPRSIHNEVYARNASRDKSQQLHTIQTFDQSERSSYFTPTSPGHDKSAPPHTFHVASGKYTSARNATLVSDSDPAFIKASALDPEADVGPPETTFKTFAPNRRLDSGATIEGGVRVVGITERNLARHNWATSNVHPFVHNFTSPIDLVQGDSFQGIPRFTRRYP